MFKFFIIFAALSLTLTCTSNKSQNKMEDNSLVFSEFDGGSGSGSFVIIDNEGDLHSVIRKKYPYKTVGVDTELEKKLPSFNKNLKTILYDFPESRSGSHKFEKISGTEVKDGVLEVYVESMEEEGKTQYQIQIVTKPWMVFKVPKNYKFDKIKVIRR